MLHEGSERRRLQMKHHVRVSFHLVKLIVDLPIKIFRINLSVTEPFDALEKRFFDKNISFYSKCEILLLVINTPKVTIHRIHNQRRSFTSKYDMSLMAIRLEFKFIEFV